MDTVSQLPPQKEELLLKTATSEKQAMSHNYIIQHLCLIVRKNTRKACISQFKITVHVLIIIHQTYKVVRNDKTMSCMYLFNNVHTWTVLGCCKKNNFRRLRAQTNHKATVFYCSGLESITIHVIQRWMNEIKCKYGTIFVVLQHCFYILNTEHVDNFSRKRTSKHWGVH